MSVRKKNIFSFPVGEVSITAVGRSNELKQVNQIT